MKIYISCNGLGLGHVGRMLPVANMLTKRGDSVIFGTWGPAIEFTRKNGFFCYELQPVDWKDDSDGSFDLYGTLVSIPSMLFELIVLFFQERKILKKEKPSVIISDGSLAHIAGKTLSIPSIYAYHQMDFPVNSIILRKTFTLIHNILATRANKIAILDFKAPENICPTSNTNLKNVTYIGPIAGSIPDEYDNQNEIKKKLKIQGKLCIIVMSGPKNSPIALEKKILEIEPDLMKMKDWTFIIKMPTKHKDIQNIRHVTWIDDIHDILKACDIVVSRSGYSTICSNLAFAKKSILIPQPKQVEQETNAQYLKLKGVAEAICQDELHKLPQRINDTYNRKIDTKKLKRISDKINECNASQKMIEIVWNISTTRQRLTKN